MLTAMRHARAIYGLCAAMRITAAKSGKDTFSDACFTMAGCPRRMAPGFVCYHPHDALGPSMAHRCEEHLEYRGLILVQVPIAPIIPANRSGSMRSKHRSGRMNSFESPY